jgi:osmotically-inducible protein OsmY
VLEVHALNCQEAGMKVRTLLLGGVVGALAAYFLDPQKGPRRRNVAMDRASSMMQRGAETASGAAQYAGGHVTGVIRETAPHQPDNPNPDDITLKDRIESELFRDPRFSREHLNILVVDGVVDLHGQLPAQDQIDEVLRIVSDIPNVRGVMSYLHLPGTPAPNKEEALAASQQYARQGR